MGKKFLGLMALTLAVTVSRAGAELRDFVVLKTGADGKTTVSGNAALAEQKFTPASTFKVLIAWAALEEGLVTPETKHLVKDQFVPGAPRELDLHDALYFSSNDYFDWLGKKLGREKLEKYLTRSGYAGGQAPQGWLDDMDAVERGGSLTITPRENHEFMRRLEKADLYSSRKVGYDLMRVLRWPADSDKVSLMGKTGSADGALWFNGCGVAFLSAEIVTVFAKGSVELRPLVIQKFYDQFGLKFNEAWLKEYPADNGVKTP
ncbi:MAG: serine hydrolase [Verrucomicrobiales bacterium]|jgi:beta-lactamase class D|nr:serine hydrolase [Verrucomicrobiales bacterium]